MVKRIYVEKKIGFDVEAQCLLAELKESFRLEGLKQVRVFNRYDMEGLTEDIYQASKYTIFAEPAIDMVFEESLDLLKEDARYFAVEYLPGQFDQRADSAAQCIQLISMGEKPVVRFAKLIYIEGSISDTEFEAIKSYCINPVDSQEATIKKPDTLAMAMANPPDVSIVTGFIDRTESELSSFRSIMGFAMSLEDLQFVQTYFKSEEHRDPTETELRVIDTYWSDHCRHTTFLTKITKVVFSEGPYKKLIEASYADYLDMRQAVYGQRDKDVSLMDLAVIGAKYLKIQGKLNDLDESDEINACSIKVKADINGVMEDWLVMFKNETHNHPTEIEPFGGAATCLGGAIRDPLSGRVYVYQAMRVTGSGDPKSPIEETLPGKLPQRKITREAAAGYSSYGNQIGLATGQVTEIYHEGYVAKRMEVGAVIGAAPAKNVNRAKPDAGDAIILVGGRTGRDGCGGATGSSKEHTEDSISTCSAEVQKGNPPVERNIQRLFRREEVTRLIKKCNDFGAGGISVAIGELADSIDVDLDKVLKKYDGLNGTELAISESQERMAVVVSAADYEAFAAYAAEENLEAVAVAKVTESGRLRMYWREKCILDLQRNFLDTNGVKQETEVLVDCSLPLDLQDTKVTIKKDMSAREQIQKSIADLNAASQRGLIERFDSTIGSSTILMPLGGRYQLTPAVGMAAKLPVLNGDTDTSTLMSFGFDPDLSLLSPYHGALFAVVDSVTKIAAMGGDYTKVRLSFQEYFERLGNDPTKWGKPFSALLGALRAQKELGIPAIGGKDSMSGTFNERHVPPTLISFAVGILSAEEVLSPEFKKTGSKVIHLYVKKDDYQIIDFDQYKTNMDFLRRLTKQGLVLAANVIGKGGLAVSVAKMSMGNKIGVDLHNINFEALTHADYGSLILEIAEGTLLEEYAGKAQYRLIGKTLDVPRIRIQGIEMDLERLIKDWSRPLEQIFPTKPIPQSTGEKDWDRMAASQDCTRLETAKEQPPLIQFYGKSSLKPLVRSAQPKVAILTFPGTNCEMDSKRAFVKAGADANIMILRNLTQHQLDESIREMAAKIKSSQILMLPGGFSGGDEPDGSAKFITAVFRNPLIHDAVMDLVDQRDGLILGICNGFQALIKLGLVPYGKIIEASEDSPTLTYNSIGRHMSKLVKTRIASVQSPWLSKVQVGDVHTIPISHGEGRFIAEISLLNKLMGQGQIATQYVDHCDNPTMDIEFNPNDSIWAIEGITSPDGRIFGKMGHSERIGLNLYKNVPGTMNQKIFEAGVAYFK